MKILTAHPRRLAMVLLASWGIMFKAVAEPPSEWKEYENQTFGFRMTVKREWTEMDFTETKETGSVTFQISATPHVTVTVSRTKAEYPFDVWMSSDVLSQLYLAGYQRFAAPVEFAGRRSVKVVGTGSDKEARREEDYYSDRSPFIDEISFSAPADSWSLYEHYFAGLRKSIHWTR